MRHDHCLGNAQEAILDRCRCWTIGHQASSKCNVNGPAFWFEPVETQGSAAAEKLISSIELCSTSEPPPDYYTGCLCGKAEGSLANFDKRARTLVHDIQHDRAFFEDRATDRGFGIAMATFWKVPIAPIMIGKRVASRPHSDHDVAT